MASAPVYCTHQQLKRVFPQIDEFDGKTPVYGWATAVSDFHDVGVDLYHTNNSGRVDRLFWDGAEIEKIAFNTTETTKVDGALFTPSATVFYVDAGHGLEENDIVKIDNEYIRVVSVADDTITITTPGTNRGLCNTSAQHHANDTSVYKIIDASVDLGDATSSGRDAMAFVYDDDLDLCLLVTQANPSDYLIESGENFEDLVTKFRQDASRYLDSRLDPKLPKNQLRDKEGNFDYMILRTAALYASAFMIRTKEPTSDMAAAIILEADNNVQLLNEGRASLSWQNTGDASKGVLRDVTYTGDVRPVDFRGRASGVDYDLIKLEIEDAGAIGTCTYNVSVKNGDGLKQDQVVSDEKITGDYQTLAYGLQVRFAGTTDTSAAVATDEWEVEVRGYNEEVDVADLKGIKMTRRRHYL